MMECLKKPYISKNSINILKQKDQQVPTYLDMDNFYEVKRKKEDLKR